MARRTGTELYIMGACSVGLLACFVSRNYDSLLRWSDAAALEESFGPNWHAKLKRKEDFERIFHSDFEGSSMWNLMKISVGSKSMPWISYLLSSYILAFFLSFVLIVNMMKYFAKTYGFYSLDCIESESYINTMNSKEEKIRRDSAVNIAKNYYNLVSNLYEFAWGEIWQIAVYFGFHKESYEERGRRRCYWLAHRGHMAKGQKWIDLGCGVGGPLRCIVRFSGANVTGITIDKTQVVTGTKYIEQEGLSKYASIRNGDFHKLTETFTKNTYDGAYACEAICHSKDPMTVFKELFKVLKPGAVYCGYEWLLADKFDFNNADHVACKEALTSISGLAHLIKKKDFLQNVLDSGFTLVEHYDMEDYYDELLPEKWQDIFNRKISIKQFLLSKVGIRFTTLLFKTLALFNIVDSGLSKFQEHMATNIAKVCEIGDNKCIHFQYYVKAQKPYDA